MADKTPSRRIVIPPFLCSSTGVSDRQGMVIVIYDPAEEEIVKIMRSPVFMWHKTMRRPKVHLLEGIARYTRCGRVRRDNRDYHFSNRCPADLSFCMHCNWTGDIREYGA